MSEALALTGWLRVPYLRTKLAEKTKAYILSEAQVSITSHCSPFVRWSVYKKPEVKVQKALAIYTTASRSRINSPSQDENSRWLSAFLS